MKRIEKIGQNLHGAEICFRYPQEQEGKGDSHRAIIIIDT